MAASPPSSSPGEVYLRLHHLVVDVWRRMGRPSRDWMADRSGIPVEVFPELERGEHLTWRSAEAVLVACEVHPRQIRAWQEYLWAVAGVPRASSAPRGSRAALGHVRGTAAARGRSTVRPERRRAMDQPDDAEVAPLDRARQATTGGEYQLALESLRQHRRRSFQQISAAAGGDLLPKSTAHYMCRKGTLPARREQVRLFVLGCGEPPRAAELWAVEWERLVAMTRAVKEVVREEEMTLVMASVKADDSVPVDDELSVGLTVDANGRCARSSVPMPVLVWANIATAVVGILVVVAYVLA